MSKLENSLSSGAHHQLLQLIGEWRGTSKVWFGPDQVPGEPEIKGIIKPLFDGRFIFHEYESSFDGKPLQGIVIYGCHLATGTFQSIWLDTFHTGTGMMFSEGPANGDFATLLGHYGSGETPPQLWGWRTGIEVVNADHVIITAYNISPEGEEWKATEIDYHRV